MEKKQVSIGQLITTTTLSLLGGLIITLTILQYDPEIKNFFGKNIINMFARSMDCKMKGSLSHINFFTPTITLSRISTNPKSGTNWKWNCEKLTLNFSWLQLIWHGVVNLHVTVDHVYAKTTIHNGNPDISKHLARIVSGIPKGFPLALKSITFKTASINMHDNTEQNKLSLCWSGESKVIGASFKSRIHFIDGAAEISGRKLFNQLGGTLECYVPKNQTKEPFVIRSNCSLGIPLLHTSNKNCFLTGYFIKDHGMFTLQSADGSFLCGPLRLTEDAGNLCGELYAKFPISCITNILLNSDKDNGINGTCVLQTKAYLNTNPYRLLGSLSLYDITYNDHQLIPSGKLTFNKQNHKWSGTTFINCLQEGSIEGSIKFDEKTQTGAINTHNKKKLQSDLIAPWCIETNKFSSSIQIDPQKITGSYAITSLNPKIKKNCVVKGTTSFEKNNFCTHGTIDNQAYNMTIDLNNSVELSACYSDQDGNKLINIESTNQKKSAAKNKKINKSQTQLETTIAFPFVRSLVHKYSDIDLQGEGTIKLWTVIKPEHIALKAHLDEGTIRLPHTYNFINGFDAFATFNFKNKQMNIHKIMCNLHKGSITCNSAIAHFSNGIKPSFMQIPLLVDSCLINNKDDLFTVVSGNIVFTKDLTKKSINGALLLDRTQIKNSIFSLIKKDSSPSTQSGFNLYDTDCAISIATQSPIRIKMPFLETTAKINLMVKQNFKDPAITGSIELLSGAINFPYKPLYITKAHLNFLPHQLYDPIIEVTAKNKIKKYTITMSINGSLQNYSIHLESTPPLNEEQIIALLLAGSEEESLSVVAPALIMQNIKTLIFSSSSTLTSLDSYVRNVFNPFKHIHLVPSFIDQSGRGGLRAAIEIDINERWRAFIQKNFSLSEDTRFEVDYFLSDDICFKAVRDEHRDLSGEVEMRWKF